MSVLRPFVPSAPSSAISDPTALALARSAVQPGSTVSALLADTGAPQGVGTRREAGGHRYVEVEAAATAFDVITAGGVKHVVEPGLGGLYLSAFLDGSPNAKLAFKRAIEAMNRRGCPLIVDAPITVSYDAVEDVAKLADGAHVIFRAPVTLASWGLPLLWHETEDGGGVTLDTPHVKFAGEAATDLPQMTHAFFAETWTDAAPYSNRAQTGLLFFRGTHLRINGMTRIEAVDFSRPERLVPRGLVLLKGPNGSPGRLHGGDFWFDGTLFGLVCTGFDHLAIADVYSDRWSQLDTTQYGWEAPGHVFYFTPDTGGAYHISMGNCYDEGREIGTPYVTGAVSYKCNTQAGTFQAGYLFSRRRQGLCDLTARNLKLGGGMWDGAASSNAQFVQAKAARLANFGSGGVEGADFGTLVFRMPPDYSEYVQIDAERAVGTLVFDIPGTAFSSQLISGVMNNCRFDMQVWMPQGQASSSPVAVSVRSGGSNNQFCIRTDSPDWAKMRVIAQDKANSRGNSAEIHDMRSGSKRVLSGYSEQRVVRFSERISAPAGASHTLASLMPKGAVLESLTSYVESSLGTSNGLTTYQIGTTADPDLFGSALLNSGRGTGTENWTADASGWQSSALDLVMTAVGGDFDGTGEVQIAGTYALGLRYRDLI